MAASIVVKLVTAISAVAWRTAFLGKRGERNKNRKALGTEVPPTPGVE